jgi:endonuclease-3
MQDNQINDGMRILRRVAKDMPVPFVTRLARQDPDPFLILVSTILSLRTRDVPTEQASERLFKLARTPTEMIKLSHVEIAQAISPVLYPGVKAQNLLKICDILLNQYDGRVPADLDELDALPGVGRKTANLVIILGFNKLGICVDVHVHRITNRWGYVRTKTPDDTELALREKLPKRYWKEINSELVSFGQNICLPTSPLCSVCPLFAYCDRVGVKHSR